jgi:MFS family permease
MSGSVHTFAGSRVRLTLWAGCLGMLVLGANGTAIMAALPTMRRELGLSATEVGWAINAYLIVSAACVIAGGKAGDQVGARRVSIAGLVLFAAASVVIATAGTPALLLAGRALQGLAAALAVPGTLAALGEASAPAQRAGAIGAWAGFLMLGFSLGPLIGGALTHYAGWRVIFWASGAAMLVAAGSLVAAHGAAPAPRAGRVGRFDWAGFALLAVCMVALVSALHTLPEAAHAPFSLVGYVALAGVTGFALLGVERRIGDPLIDLGLFSGALFVRALVAGSIAMGCILTLLLYYNLDAQSPTGLAMTPVGAGLSLLPMSAGLLTFAFSAPALIRRFGPQRVLTAGMLLIAAAGVVIVGAATARMLVPLAVGLFGIGLGLALPYATAPRLALSTLPPAQAGAGSGVVNACTFLGGSIGVASGAVAFGAGGLPGAIGLVVALALAGAWVCRGLARAA